MAAESQPLQIRRTLVIGLGTTGKEVAEQLAEHLTWEYGSFEKASWVRMLVLETDKPTSPLGDRVLWSGMTREEFAPYQTTPRTAGAAFNFFEWQDSPTLRVIKHPSTGAGNCRMLGRLCLYHDRTYEQFKMRVSRDLAHLSQITPLSVAEALGQPELRVEFHPDIVVYAVGTLCGGTCSGGAADVGYLIDIWSNGTVKMEALFTLPHPGFNAPEAPRYKKNAYYALKELNHYLLPDTSWLQKLPEYSAPAERRASPYDITRVLMPSGGTREDVPRLNTTIAQYLAAAVGPAGAEIAASDVDAYGYMESADRVGFMRPLFSTMGVATLEFPGEHIQRAATSRLLGAAFRRWCDHRIEPARVDQALQSLGGADFDALLRRLTQDSDRISIGAFQEQFKPLSEGKTPRVDQVRQLLRQVDDRLQAIEAPKTNGNGEAAPTLIQVMEGNQQRFIGGIDADVHNIVDRTLFELDGGPGVVAAVLRKYVEGMETWAQEAQQNLAEYRQDSRSMREILDQQLGEVERIQGSANPFGKSQRLREAWEDVVQKLNSYIETETRMQAVTHLQRRDMVREMVDRYRAVTTLVIDRLDALRSAFVQAAGELEDEWKAMAAASPSVNGRAYFDPEPPAARGTVSQEYFNMLRERRWSDEPAVGWDEDRKEEAALKEVIRRLAPLRDELYRDAGASAFDARPGAHTSRESIPATVYASAEDAARGFFSRLREQVHIADRVSDTELSTIILASEPQLKVSATQVSEQLAGARGVAPMQPNFAYMDMEGGGKPRPQIARVAERITNNLSLRRGRIVDSQDPYRLLLIREKHGFTMGQMEGVVASNARDLSALQSADGRTDFPFWYTRRDVDWIEPLVPPALVDRTEENWLLVALLGHAAETALPWLPASRGEIEPEGWYTISGGEFRVSYPQGVDAPEKETTLPLRFTEAVGKLLTREYTVLQRSLGVRVSSYVRKCGEKSVVEIGDAALKAFDVFGLTGIDARAADAIIRRSYRRSDALTRAFFEFKTRELASGGAEFAMLYHTQGEPIPDRGTAYPADAYYCPACHHMLGGEVSKLLEGMFKCPACNSEERYWP